MHAKAAITVNRARDEVERLWRGADHPSYLTDDAAVVSFRDAPGDRGTEIYVDLEKSTSAGKLGDVIAKVTGAVPLAQVKDDLRRFKQRAETGEVPRSDGTPSGEKVDSKLNQRPAQPLSADEREEVGV